MKIFVQERGGRERRLSERRNPLQAIFDKLVCSFCFGKDRLVHCHAAQKGTEDAHKVVLLPLLAWICVKATAAQKLDECFRVD